MIRLILEAVKEWVEETLISFKAMYLGYVTPQMYGAKADGVTDDTQAIQSAVNHGGVVYFPQGTYRAKNIVINSDTSLIGERGLSVIKATDNAGLNDSVLRVGITGLETSEQTNINISDLIIRGSETVGDASAGITLLEIWHSSNVGVQNVRFQNNTYASIRLINGANNISISNCKFEACDVGVISQGSTRTSNNVTIRDCVFTGHSSFNTFTNYYSEPISIYTQASAGVSKHWTIENCIFEQKYTNAICLQEKRADANPENMGDDKTLVEDCVIRNITVRGCVGAINMAFCRNVTIDGVHIDNTTPDFQYSLYRLINIDDYCDNVTLKNATVDRKDLLDVIHLQSLSKNCIIDNIILNTEIETPIYLSGTNHIIKNVLVNASNENRNTKISCTDLINSYVDIRADINSPKLVQYLVNGGNSGNAFIIDSDVKVGLNRQDNIDHTTIADTNRYIIEGNGEEESGALSQVNVYKMPKVLRVLMTTLDVWTANMTANKNYYLLEDGHELTLKFVWYNNAVSGNRDFRFPTDGNIIPINKPFRLSQDYSVVCHFKQINNKWVETQRLLEYYAGATVDVTDTDQTDIDFSESGDLVIKGTDGTMRRIIFNQDGTCSWATLS